MERPSRRELLAGAAALAAGVLVPVEVTRAGAGPGAQQLEVRALAIARTVEDMGPAVALATARAHHELVQVALRAASREHQRRPLHRASSMSALVCARASRWAGLDWTGWLTLAETAARSAGDGPLLATALLERGNATGEAAHCADCLSPAAMDLYAAALDRAGAGEGQCGVRADARFQLGWELAAAGNDHGALLELDAAMLEAQRAGWPASVVDSRVGNIHYRLGHLVDAELSLSRAVDTPPPRRVWVLCSLAHTHLGSGEVDAAAGALEEAFLLTRAHGIPARLPRILAVRSLLPPGRAARQLDELMRGA
jgi:hypothetical protein